MARKTLDWTRMGMFLIRFSYYGKDYFGLSAQTEQSSASFFKTPGKRARIEVDKTANVLPTIESTIEAAMQKANLIKSLNDSQCSRCGRTDRGVHARANYITLKMRLKGEQCSPADEDSKTSADDDALWLRPTGGDSGHYDYAGILNGLLPPTIRVIWVKACPVYFDARFHCLHRMYHYYFPITEDLDIDLMNFAARQLLGSHDFKNFCKVDTSARKTTTRQLLVCRVEILNEDVAVVLVNAPAFLWHQVRCIVGILTSVGRGAIPPDAISKWLDLTLTPVKPPYAMAPPDGLILWDCAFEALPSVEAISRENRDAWKPSFKFRPRGLRSDLSTRSRPTDAFRIQSASLAVQKCVMDCLATAMDEQASFFDVWAANPNRIFQNQI